MKKLTALYLMVIIILSTIILHRIYSQTETTITYFPPDETVSFVEHSTTLDIIKLANKHAEIEWNVHSKTNKPMYLRQDVSLVYADGKLKAIHNKWLQQTDLISFQEKLTGDERVWQAITLHHGESHVNEETIRSKQLMSSDTLFIKRLSSDQVITFHQAQSVEEQRIKEELINQLQLHPFWDKLINHFNIQQNDYEMIPLTHLPEYSNKPLPNLDQKQTAQVIGQLWEGLYKNYLIPIVSAKKTIQAGIPIILISKNHDHLLILYDIDGEKQKLIQNIPF
ncbi:MAG TPA: hypothetical protein VIG73_15340 [Cerasibacillus sp.]|uniref:hypothetical protein n=1 Tax=Cerasibacillus sp. TaxID=2498711 RepID=UPI002F3EF1DC